MTARLALAGCALLAVLALPATASATRGLTTGLTGPGEYQSADASERALWFGRTSDAGAGIVRLAVGWSSTVTATRPPDPTNPASTSYNFTSIDGAVRDAQQRGLKVLLTVNVAPTWAEGPGRPASASAGTWKVSPSDLADFDQALASRYSGSFDPDGAGPQPTLPAVQALQVWDEPNQDAWLGPQFDGKTAVGPALYRDILNASYKSIKAVNPQMLVVVGGTSPYGDNPGGPYPPGGARARPVTFWQNVLCVRPVKSKKPKKGKKAAPTKYVRTAGCSSKVNFDVFAHQAINNTGAGPTQSAPNPNDASTPDLGRVVSVLRAAEKAGTAGPGGRHPVWVTEFWWDSNPPNPVGAKLAVQARYIEQSLYLFWKAGASTAINFEIRDTADRPNVHAGLQSGLYFIDGRPKPSLGAFKFPFVTERTSRNTLQAWGIAPESGKLLIQRQQGSRWRTVKRLQAGKGSVFVTKLKLAGKQRLRATVGSSQSLVWRQAAFATKSSGGGGPSPLTIILASLGALALIVATAALLRRRRLQRDRRHRRSPRPVPG
jgi:hypothetical protein